MKPRGLLPLVLAFLGCTERIQEGGFETSDLQARVTRPDGSPVAAARVWLVRSRGDSAPATVIDSTLTDSAGKAQFLYGKGADLSAIGLDAQSGDSLGIAPSAFRNGTSATVAVQETKSVRIGRDSTGAVLELHVPGCHFVSSASEDGSASILSLPKGTWDVALVAGTSVRVIHALPVLVDTVLAEATTPVGDTSNRTVDTLRDGPDITLDSFRVDGIAELLDTSLSPAWNWQDMNDSNSRTWIDSPRLVSEDSGWTGLATRPLRYLLFAVDSSSPDSMRSLVQDTLETQGGAWIRSPLLPDTGTIAIQMRFNSGLPSTDSGLFRTLRLTDSAGSGLVLLLPGALSDPDSIGVRGSLATTESGKLSTAQIQDSKIWYISWSSHSITARTSDGIAGSVAPLSSLQSPIRLEFELLSPVQGLSSQMHIQSIRLYKPK
jgi:hypothetical protein